MEEESLLFKEKEKCAKGEGDFEHATSHVSSRWCVYLLKPFHYHVLIWAFLIDSVGIHISSFQTRKISKKWTAKHKRELEEIYEKETVTEIPDAQKSLLQKQRPSMKKIFSRPKKSLEGKFSADGLPKSPSGRLTKYFSGKLYLTCNKIFTKFHNHQKFHFITLPLAFIAWRLNTYI